MQPETLFRFETAAAEPEANGLVALSRAEAATALAGLDALASAAASGGGAGDRGFYGMAPHPLGAAAVVELKGE